MWLNRYTKLLVGFTFLLIVAGGLVTSTQSGLSVPDWPLSYGKFMPPMVGGVRYEHSHRMIASLVGLMTLILTFWLGFREKRSWVRWLGIAALAAVVTQGVLGGMTVLFLLPTPISIFHACLAQTFFSLIVALAFFTSREWLCKETFSGGNLADLKAPLRMMIALVYLQLVLGATLRHTGNPMVALSHALGSFFVLINVVLIMTRVFNRYGGEKKLIYPALALSVVTLFQMALGMGSFVYIFMLPAKIQPEAERIFFVTAHQSLGALLLAASVFFALRIYHRGNES